jgi:hypothetical protein
MGGYEADGPGLLRLCERGIDIYRYGADLVEMVDEEQKHLGAVSRICTFSTRIVPGPVQRSSTGSVTHSTNVRSLQGMSR